MTEKAFQDYYPDELSHCYGCGRLNEYGLQLKSYWDGDETVARFTPRAYHIAIPGYVYGGLIASLIDCHATGTASAAAYREAGREMGTAPPLRFVTAALHVDYLRPTPLGVQLEIRGRVKELRGRKVIVIATVSAAGDVCARGEVVAVQMPNHLAPARTVTSRHGESMVEAAVRPRSAIATEHTWDTASVFPSPEAWEVAFKDVEGQLARLRRFKGRLGDGPASLVEWFETYQRVFRMLGHVMIYASMGHTVETTDQDAAARFDRARGLMARATAAAAFADPEIAAVGFEALRRWLQDDHRLPLYTHYLDRLERRQPYLRSPEVEELLGHVLDPFRTAAATHRVLADADLTFAPAHATGSTTPIEVAQGNLSKLQAHPDREVRRTAWESYADAHLANKNTMANCIAAGVKQNVFMARARRYGSALEAALLPNHIPVEVFHNLLAVFRRNLPIWHRYWRVRRGALAYDRLFPYDRSAPLGASRPWIPFSQAVEWICQGMRPLGDEYVSVMRRGLLEQRWVDIYPNKGKRAGAFSAGSQGTHPFILMSYTDDIFSMSTLAHELGHSMHSYYSWKTQPFIYARYPIFLAEVASNFNQALVRAYLLATNPDPDLQLAVLEEAMSNFYRYFFVMPTLARFEMEIHQRIERSEALTARVLIDLMADLLGEGYGGEVEVDHDRVGIMWAEFPTHLYMNFYVFQYSTGISGAHALAERVLAGSPGAADAYLAFLKAGGSKFPLDALREAGVDLSTPEPVERAFAILARTVDQLDLLLARRSGAPS